MTLFEVLLALAIFLASLAALAHLIAAGTRAAVQGRLQTQAIVRCKSKLAEVVAGAETLETVSNVSFGDDQRWSWSLTVEQGPWPELKTVQVTVAHIGGNSLGNTSYALHSFVRDPRLFETEKVRTPVRVAPPRNHEPAVSGRDPDQPEDLDR